MPELLPITAGRAGGSMRLDEPAQLIHKLGIKLADALHIADLAAGNVIKALFHMAGKIQIQKAECPHQGIHQLFPALQDNTYDPTAYGYTCVPVGFDWKPGLRHIYTLNFLGSNAGAGQYPPEDHPEFTTDVTVVPTPDDKEPGDNVLDNPITFTVDVAGWKNATEDPTPTPMP